MEPTEPQLGEWPNKPPRAHEIMKVIRSLIAAGAPITITDHAEERMIERDLDMNDVLRGFRIGDAVKIEPGQNAGEWACTVASPVLRNPEVKREIGILTIVVAARSLILGTVKWVDET